MKSPCGHVSLLPKFTLSMLILAFNALGSLLLSFYCYTSVYKTSCPDFNPLPVTYRRGQAFIAGWSDVEKHWALVISCLGNSSVLRFLTACLN